MRNLFIRDRNIKLWEKLLEKYNIEIKPNILKEYMLCSKGDNATIFYDTSNICEDSFTHELLHLNLKYHEFYLGSAIKLNILSDTFFIELFPTDLLDHLGNVLDHVKMFEQYKSLGYDEERFIQDFNTKKINDNNLNILIENYWINNKINSKVVHYYIGILSAMLGDTNEKHNYNNEYIKLQDLDSDLYDAIANLFVETINHDYQKADYMYNYQDIAMNLMIDY